MVLYGVAVSPFVQRVLVAARIKGVELAVTPMPGGLGSAEFGALSPMRRVPVLDDGGVILCESMAIVAHLDEALPGPALLPAGAADRGAARAIAAIADSEFGEPLRRWLQQKAFRVRDQPALLETARAQMDRALDAIERLMAPDGGWAVARAASVADVALAPLVALGEVLEGHAGLPPFLGARPRLARWQDHVFADRAFAPMVATLRADYLPFVDAALQQQAQQQQ